MVPMEPKPTAHSRYKAAWQGFLLHAEHSLVTHKNQDCLLTTFGQKIKYNSDMSMK